jgi:hypothetical protein
LLGVKRQIVDKKITKGINKKHSHEITKEQVKAKLKSRRLAIPSGKFNK